MTLSKPARRAVRSRVRSTCAFLMLASLPSLGITQQILDANPVVPDLRAIEAAKLPAPGEFTIPVSPITPDPTISLRPSAAGADPARSMQARKNRALANGSTQQGAANPVSFYSEMESTQGDNDSIATAERIRNLNTGTSGRNSAIVSGNLFGELNTRDLVQAEDDGSIPLALESGVTQGPDGIRFSGVIGDGPSAGVVSDFDFVKASLPQGTVFQLAVRTPEPFGDLDPFVTFFAEDGTILGTADDGGDGFDTFVTIVVPFDLTFYMSIGGFGAFFPNNPFDSESGSITGSIGSEGEYEFEMTVFPTDGDTDSYSLHLNKGDVLGVAARNNGAPALTIFNPDGELEKSVIGFGSFAVPESPLPVNGTSVIDYVADETGVYTVQLKNGLGDYELELGVFQPALEADPKRVQLVWLDYNGGPVSKEPWFGFPLITDHTPFRDFLPAWGLSDTQDDVSRITSRITEEVRDNLKQELEESGGNNKFDVVVLGNDGTGIPDWLEPHIDAGSFEMFGITYEVSTIDISGTIPEAFIGTIGIASEIDPGNYSLYDTALVLLDILSAPASGFNANFTFSLNDVVLAPSATKEDLVVTVLANIITHEAGHYLGNWHTDGVFTSVHNMMDEGPGGLFNLAGIGPSGVFGAEDQTDVAFIDDDYSVLEPFTGREDTAVNTAFGLHYGPSNGSQGAPSPR